MTPTKCFWLGLILIRNSVDCSATILALRGLARSFVLSANWLVQSTLAVDSSEISSASDSTVWLALLFLRLRLRRRVGAGHVRHSWESRGRDRAHSSRTFREIRLQVRKS